MVNLENDEWRAMWQTVNEMLIMYDTELSWNIYNNIGSVK